MLIPFEYFHVGPGKAEYVAGWGIWSTQAEDAIVYDGFSSEAQAQAGVEVLESAPYFNRDDDLSALNYLHWPQEIDETDRPDFRDVFGHDWQCIKCPENCETCGTEEK